MVFEVVVMALEAGCGTRVPVLALGDALTAGGARCEPVTVTSDAEIDEILASFDGPAPADGLLWPDPESKRRLAVASSSDGQVRAVVRRMVKRYAVPPRFRPDALDPSRTLPDLPPIAILPMAPGGLATTLGLPTEPEAVAHAVLDGQTRRLDLLRTDAGSVTLDSALLGTADGSGRATAWRARIDVDDAVLTDGSDDLLACVVANGTGHSIVDGLPMVPAADPADGMLDVAVAIAVRERRTVRVEVRRARGRAVSVAPREPVPILDDGVAGELNRRRSWWVEPGAWAVYHTAAPARART